MTRAGRRFERRPPTRAEVGVVLSLAAAAIAVFSIADSGRGVWRGLSRQHAALAAMTASERRNEPAARVGLSLAVLGFYERLIAPGDRVYVQLGERQPAAGVVVSLLQLLLPAQQTSQLADATVVLSYRADPGRLGLSFVTQREDGRLPVYVSRIGAP